MELVSVLSITPIYIAILGLLFLPITIHVLNGKTIQRTLIQLTAMQGINAGNSIVMDGCLMWQTTSWNKVQF